jgi:hypothetical protein
MASNGNIDWFAARAAKRSKAERKRLREAGILKALKLLTEIAGAQNAYSDDANAILDEIEGKETS